jgi:tRNA-dihydrouridine synthase 2
VSHSKPSANLVWGPETVDRAMIGCTREVDHVTGVVRFMKAGKSIWDTHPIEKDRLIYQIGSATPELAVQAAKLIEQDVAGVDLNCGCPKRGLSWVRSGASDFSAAFSTTGSMGAALLSEPDTLCAVGRF